MATNAPIWMPNPGPQTDAFLCECDEVMFGGGRGCVHPDTLLDTPHGQVKIKDWKGGMIYSYKNGEVITARATASLEFSEEDMYEVELLNGFKVTCTDEHKFLVSKDMFNPDTSDGWLMLKELRQGHYVMVKGRGEYPYYMPIKSIRKVNSLNYWDLHVLSTNCYFAQGILHHNSGKSSLLFGKVLQHIEKNRGRSKMIFFRENFDDLADLVSKGKDILEPHGLATYISGQTREFRFQGPFEGAWLKMRQIEHRDGLGSFKGHEYTLIAFDEICDFKLPFHLIQDTFLATLRNPHGIKSQIVYTGNPGGYNHTAVKKYFIDPWPAGSRIIENEFGMTRCFFQSTVKDNPALAKDKTYIRQLERISDPVLRKAWLEGDWTVTLGSMFGDVWSPRHHVVNSITPQDIPDHFERYRALDWGSSTPFAYLRAFISTGEDLHNGINFPAGSVVFYNEYYGWKPGNKVNEGLRISSHEVAKEIRSREDADGDFHKINGGIADNQIFSVLDGTPIYAEFYKMGVKFSESNKAAGTRATGCEIIRNKLIGYDDKPQLYFTRDCVHTIRTLPTLQRDQVNPEVLANYQENHCLSEGTWITVRRSGAKVQRKIECVEVGDEVLTRVGWRPVTKAGLTQRDSIVYFISCSTLQIEGTYYHPVFTLNRGWVFLGEVAPKDLLLKENVWSQRLLSLMASSLEDTLNPSMRTGEGTSNPEALTSCVVLNHYTGRSGSSRMGLFQKGAMFIILMATISIMMFLTLLLSTAGFTYLTIAKLRSSLTPIRRVFKRGQYAGEDRQKEELVTAGQQKRGGLIKNLRWLYVVSAENLLSLCSFINGTTSALQNAVKPIGEPAVLMLKKGSAWSATKILQSIINTRKPNFAVQIVSECGKSQREANVYNLEVEGQHEYYANGVLVHNCFDAVKYLLLSLNALHEPKTLAQERREMTARDKFLQELHDEEQ